ncbi:MAG: hypothetical protein LUQ11_00650 [Methylococcaceae bacterium]|nr:hypothetical protein [Methylococcaceae bacterium]
MKTIKLFCMGLVLVWALFGAEAWARGHHGGHFPHGFHPHPSFGLYFGLPLYSRPYYSYPYYRDPFYDPYYYPPVVTVPSAPPVYIEQRPPVTRDYPAGYWYYCSNPEGYYPYVKECPDGWQQVDPAPSESK